MIITNLPPLATCTRVDQATPTVIEVAFEHWCRVEGAIPLELLLEIGMAEVRRCIDESGPGRTPSMAELTARLERVFAVTDSSASAA